MVLWREFTLACFSLRKKNNIIKAHTSWIILFCPVTAQRREKTRERENKIEDKKSNKYWRISESWNISRVTYSATSYISIYCLCASSIRLWGSVPLVVMATCHVILINGALVSLSSRRHCPHDLVTPLMSAADLQTQYDRPSSGNTDPQRQHTHTHTLCLQTYTLMLKPRDTHKFLTHIWANGYRMTHICSKIHP